MNQNLPKMSNISNSSWRRPRGVSAATAAYLNNAVIAERYEQDIDGNVITTIDISWTLSFLEGCGKVCDLGCGTGRLMLPLVDRGMEVLGVDLSWEMLRVARQRLCLPRAGVTLLRANLVELDSIRDSAFDAAACLFSTLGMISGREARREVLRHAYRILVPGGRFLVHAHNYWHLLRVRGGIAWMLRDFVRRCLGDEAAGDCDLAQHAGTLAPALHHYRRSELLCELREVGFQVRTVQPISTRHDGRLLLPRFFPSLRAYGWLIAATRP
jgi:SAM-dependent methyltransferase